MVTQCMLQIWRLKKKRIIGLTMLLVTKYLCLFHTLHIRTRFAANLKHLGGALKHQQKYLI